MTKKQKKVLGLLGLSVVGLVFGVATTMPDQRAAAATSVTDTIQVRVVGSVPKVDISGIIDDAVYTNRIRPFNVSFENVDDLTVTLEHTDLDDNVSEITLEEAHTDYIAGTEYYEIRFINSKEENENL